MYIRIRQSLVYHFTWQCYAFKNMAIESKKLLTVAFRDDVINAVYLICNAHAVNVLIVTTAL